MDRMDVLMRRIELLDERLKKAKPDKRSEVIEKALVHVEKWIKALKPTQREIRAELLIEESAIRIREIYNEHKSLFDVAAMAGELGLKLKKPTMDHILIWNYYPENRLTELRAAFEETVRKDPKQAEMRCFKEWRGRLRSLSSQEEIANEVTAILNDAGAPVLRRFAGYLKTKDITRDRKLAANSSIPRLVQAVSLGLWKEKVRSKAQEGL